MTRGRGLSLGLGPLSRCFLPSLWLLAHFRPPLHLRRLPDLRLPLGLRLLTDFRLALHLWLARRL